MILNGKEIDFSITNVECARRFEESLNRMQGKESELQKKFKGGKLTLTELLTDNIIMLSDFFKDITGGTDVLEGVDDYMKARNIYFEFLDYVNSAKNEILSPYSPERVR